MIIPQKLVSLKVLKMVIDKKLGIENIKLKI
jgi:hypothetical protein